VSGPRWPSDEPELRSDVDGPAPAWRDAAPDPFAPIDPDAPVSGHVPAPERPQAVAEAPEHDWSAAAGRIYPLLRPAGTTGIVVETLDPAALAAEGVKAHAQPLVDEGPADLAVVYAIGAGGFDVIVNADHVLSWGVSPADVQDAALYNLATWARTADWTDERSDRHRLISSQTGAGWDAARILLPDTIAHLERELRGEGRILVGLPERHLLIAGPMAPDDEDFAVLLHEFVVEQSGNADEPIDRRLFELVDGRLVPFGQ
jgi:hypothetical protein